MSEQVKVKSKSRLRTLYPLFDPLLSILISLLAHKDVELKSNVM